MNIIELTEKFKAVKICSDAADILDEIFEQKCKSFSEIDSIRFVDCFFEGLCAGESMSTLNEDNPFHWFSTFYETIFDMFLDRHGYYLSPDRTKIIKR